MGTVINLRSSFGRLVDGATYRIRFSDDPRDGAEFVDMLHYSGYWISPNDGDMGPIRVEVRRRRENIACRGHRESVVRFEYVEMLDHVSPMVDVRASADTRRIGGDAEGDAMLAARFERPEAKLGVGLRNRDVVGEARPMLDLQAHRHCCCCWWA